MLYGGMDQPNIIVSADLRLVPPGLHHAEDLHIYGRDERFCRPLKIPVQKSVEEARAFLRGLMDDNRQGSRLYWVAELRGKAVGTLGLIFHAWRSDTSSAGWAPEAEFGYGFSPEVWGTGTAGRAANAVITWARHTLGLRRIAFYTRAGNESAIRGTEKLGFHRHTVLPNHYPDGEGCQILWRGVYEERNTVTQHKATDLRLVDPDPVYTSDIYAYHQDAEFRRFLTSDPLDSETRIATYLKFLAAENAANRRRCYFIWYGDRVVGSIGFVFGRGYRRGIAEISFEVAREHWKKGIFRESLGRILPLAAREGVHKLLSFVHADNERAINAALRCGFTRDGMIKNYFSRNGSFADAALLGLDTGRRAF